MYFSNKNIFKVLDIDYREYSVMEKDFLDVLDFELVVSEKDFNDCLFGLESFFQENNREIITEA